MMTFFRKWKGTDKNNEIFQKGKYLKKIFLLFQRVFLRNEALNLLNGC